MDWTLSSDPLTIARLSMTSYVFIVLHMLLIFSILAASLTCPDYVQRLALVSLTLSPVSTSSPSSLTTSSFQAVDMTSASPSGRSCTCYLGSTITQRYEDGLCQTNSTNKDRPLQMCSRSTASSSLSI